MVDTLAQRIPVAELYDTGVSLTITLQSNRLLAADVRAALTWMSGVADGINAQLRDESNWFAEEGGEFYVIPEVSFAQGSLKIIAKLKSSYKELSEKAKDRVTQILVAVIIATGTITGGVLAKDGETMELPPPVDLVEQPEMNCTKATHHAISAWRSAQEDWDKSTTMCR